MLITEKEEELYESWFLQFGSLQSSLGEGGGHVVC